MKKIFKNITFIFRKFLGIHGLNTRFDNLNWKLTDQNNKLNKQIKYQSVQLDRVFSYLEYLDFDESKVKGSNKFQNFYNLISLLTPMDISDARYRRIGKDYDGGYVMLDDISSQNINVAYSFGISDDVSWDEEIANMGIDVYMYDHTIEKLPKQNERFHFFKEGVTGKPQVALDTLSNFIDRNGHKNSNNLILKMDIEGYEWSVFEETPSEVINQFRQIVIEFHGLSPEKDKKDLAKIFSVLQKINKTHQSIHVHANGHTPVSWLGDWAMPQLLEVTYIRREDYVDRLIPNKRTFPTHIDQPTFPWLPDVPLGKFSTENERFWFNK